MPETVTVAGEPGLSRLSVLDEGALVTGRYVLTGADNATVRLRDGSGGEHVCTDLMSAYAAVNFGHRNPAFRGAFHAESDIAALFPGPEAEQVARWLCDRLGGGDRYRVLYQVGGSFAVSTALALARRSRPGRVIAIEGAFHGLGVDTSAVTSVQREFALQDTGLTRLVAGQVELVRPGELPDGWDGVSCLLYEPIQGANGYVPLDPAWLAELTTAAKAAGVVTIADEIQCGFFRHGTFSPSAALGLDPDIVLFGKSLTNGMYPLSAVVYRQDLENGLTGPFLAHTFQTATLGPAAALEVARYLDSNDVTGMAAAVEDGLRGLAGRLAAGNRAREIYLTGPSLSFEPVRVGSRELVRRAFSRGVLVFSGGSSGQRIRVAPPLTIPAAQLAEAAEVIWSVTDE